MGLFKDIIGEWGGEIGTAVGAYFGNPQAGAAIGGALEQGVQLQEQVDAARAAPAARAAQYAPVVVRRDLMLEAVGLRYGQGEWFTWQNILGSSALETGIPQESIAGFARWYYEREGRYPHTGAYIEHARNVQREGRTMIARNVRRAQWQTASRTFFPTSALTTWSPRVSTSTALFRTPAQLRRRSLTIPGLPGVLTW